SDIHEYLYKRVGVLTCDGRYFVGTLRGFDHTTNIVLYPSEERVLRKSSQQDKQRQSVILNAMNVLKGDSVAVIGLLDDEKDREFRQQLSRA
ncbi:N-alpha-acetyltransferase 38, NatC auxiliary subunit-like protein, partial [Ramicandelaber brevisporus]